MRTEIKKKEQTNLNHQIASKGESGITLIALVVTIVVLLILAGITISLVFGSNGVINKAQEANENTKIAQVREQLELAKGPEYIEGNGKYNPDSYFERIETEGIIGNKDTDVIDNGDGTYEVTTTPGYIFKITLVPSKDNVEDIQIEHIGKVDGPRIRNLKVTNKTTNSITVEVETANAEGATYTYYYKKDGEVDWKKAEEIKEKTYTFSGLESNVIYNIKVRVEKDKKAVEKEISTITGELPEGAVQFSPLPPAGAGCEGKYQGEAAAAGAVPAARGSGQGVLPGGLGSEDPGGPPGGAGLCRHVPAAGRPAGRRVSDRGAVPLVGGRGAPERGGIAADWPVLCRGLRRHAGKINKTRAAQRRAVPPFGLERGK